MIQLFLALVFVHYLADYPLQGDFLSKAKNHTAPLPRVPWWQAMAAHSFIHAGLVVLVTGHLVLGVMEFISHALTDYNKCAGRLTYNQDQAIHIAFKLLWTVMAFALAQG